MKNHKKVLISGSLVFDTLFELTTPIREQIVIKDGKAGKQNLMFNARDKEVYFGGTAGNIAYGSRLLGDSTIVASIVGRDFEEYAKHLKHGGAQVRLYRDEKSYTATYYSMTDPSSEQIGIFQGSAYHKHVEHVPLTRLLLASDWKSIGVGIFAAGTAKSIVKQLKEFRKFAPEEALAIFDPGQMLMIDFTRELVCEALRNADILVLNDTEFLHLKKKFNITLEKIFEKGTKYIIETRGAAGSVLYIEEAEFAVKAFKVKKVVDPTGAGDAFRAGLIHGLLSGLSIPDAMRIGGKLGAACVQTNGGQTYKV